MSPPARFRLHQGVTCKVTPTSSRIALLTCLVVATILTVQVVSGSPPLDYFVYTGQSAPETANKQATLQSLNSIYNSQPTNGLAAGDDQQLTTDKKLIELSDRLQSIVMNLNHSYDNNLVDLELTRYAWHLMEKQAALYIKNRLHTLRPTLDQLLVESQVSDTCKVAIDGWLDNLADLKHWATLMWNSWGQFPPTGLFEGSFTDLGSYKGCLDVGTNDVIGEAQYCMIDLQPIVPTRPRFHSIFKRILSVDPGSNRLIGGDFNVDNINNAHTAHGFSSSRFKPVNQDTASSSSMATKYNKRTIDHNATATNASSIEKLEQSFINSNLTLKSEALIELASKAQYFYYVKFRVGACFPSKCSQKDLEKLVQAAGKRAILQASHVNCMKNEPVTLNNYQRVAACILSSLALVAVLGTIVDLLGFKERRDSSSLASWLLVFSMWTNSKRLFDFEAAGTHTDLECIHGLRFFSMLWVIYGHTILYSEYQSFTHFYEVVEKQVSSFIFLPTLNANFSVDTFFVISGILTTYVTWEYTKGDPRKFNKFAFLISRYIRLTPQLAIVILCFFLLPLFGSGPMYKQVAEDKAELCYKNWGINLLYLQSYINSERLCIDPSWWLSIEMTFHFVSLIVIVVMIQSPSKGMIVNGVIATALTLWGAAIHYTNGFAIQYLPSIPQRYEIPKEQTQLFFHRPYPHAAAYFIGIALGYVLANKTIKKLSRSKVFQGWFVCALGLSISLWGSYYWNLGAPYSQLQATIYYNLCQLLWPISIAWIILACSLGHGGFVNSILSAKCFVPLGRITYMTYLSHSLIIYYHSASMNFSVEPSMLFFTYLFIANTFLALLVGVLLTIVYESPILNLQKKLFTYLTQRFDPTAQPQPLHVTIVCDKNGPSAANAMLLPTRSEDANGTICLTKR